MDEDAYANRWFQPDRRYVRLLVNAASQGGRRERMRLMKKKTAKTQKRAKKGAIKDLDATTSPKGGLNFATQAQDIHFQKVTPAGLDLGKVAIDHHK